MNKKNRFFHIMMENSVNSLLDGYPVIQGIIFDYWL